MRNVGCVSDEFTIEGINLHLEYDICRTKNFLDYLNIAVMQIKHSHECSLQLRSIKYVTIALRFKATHIFSNPRCLRLGKTEQTHDLKVYEVKTNEYSCLVIKHSF